MRTLLSINVVRKKMETELEKVRKKIEKKEQEIEKLTLIIQSSPNDVDKKLLVEYNITLNILMNKEALLGKSLVTYSLAIIMHVCIFFSIDNHVLNSYLKCTLIFYKVIKDNSKRPFS